MNLVNGVLFSVWQTLGDKYTRVKTQLASLVCGFLHVFSSSKQKLYFLAII